MFVTKLGISGICNEFVESHGFNWMFSHSNYRPRLFAKQGAYIIVLNLVPLETIQKIVQLKYTQLINYSKLYSKFEIHFFFFKAYM